MRRGRRALDGLDQDIRDHIERETQDHIERGVPPEEARRLARLKFGNVALVKEDTRAVWVWIWLEQLVQDLRYAPRMLWRNPGFAVVVILTLGLGIGANTAIFSLMDQVLLRPLAVPRPGELVLLDGPGVYQGRTQGRQVMSVPTFRGLQEASGPVLSGLFARFDTATTVGIENNRPADVRCRRDHAGRGCCAGWIPAGPACHAGRPDARPSLRVVLGGVPLWG